MTDQTVQVACAGCGVANRIPAARLAQDPICGRCRRPLLDGAPIVLTDANFDSVVARTDLPVVVDFWAAWCGPCRAMAPQFEQAARALKGRALLAKVDSDANPQLSARLAIQSLPTLVRMARGAEVGRLAGARPAGDIIRFAGG